MTRGWRISGSSSEHVTVKITHSLSGYDDSTVSGNIAKYHVLYRGTVLVNL